MKRKFIWIALSVSTVLLICIGLLPQFKPSVVAKKTAQTPPPKHIPLGLFNAFTLQSTIPISYWYRDDSYNPEKPILFTSQEVNANLAKIAKKEQSYPGSPDGNLYAALDKYKSSLRDELFRGKNIAIIGSKTPWYESVVLFYGGTPTTISDNKIICTDSRLKTLTTEEYAQNPQLFDAVISISSIASDGLGRYGDQIDSKGDLKAMSKMKSMLNKNGLLFLAVPVGKDHLWWNVHRVYGKIRLPMLLEGWNQIDAFGFNPDNIDRDRDIQASSDQPVFVLQPNP